MNQQERDDLRVHWESFRQHRTHFSDCYKWHPECAVIKILDVWDSAELLDSRTQMAPGLDALDKSISAETSYE